MQYPLISEYVRAIQDASNNLDELAHLVPVQDDPGELYRSSGAFAVVFKMKDEQTGKCYALKCFTEEQEGRAEAYRQIADELEFVDSSYITSVKYLENEIFVDSSCEEDEFPVLLMDWIDGKTMESYIAENYQDNYTMAMLCYRFCKMAAWLRSQPFAHGDIKPDNIMVRPDGSLTLVDYDGMFVPAMKGQKSPTIGTKDFSHPLRTVDDFDETIDDFAFASIALSLKAISLNPSLLDEYGAADRLLFSAEDYCDLSKSKVLTALQKLMNDEEVNTLLALFILVIAKKKLVMCSSWLYMINKPEAKCIENLSTEVTNDDLENAIEDDFGVKYSKDGKRLLRAPVGLKTYSIREGTLCVGDRAFGFCLNLSELLIAKSVICIGNSAFPSCLNLKKLVIPQNVRYIGCNVFSSLNTTLIFKSKYFKYEDGVLFNNTKTVLIAYNGESEEYIIPNSVRSIAKTAFQGNRYLKSLVIPNNVEEIGEGAFYACRNMEKLVLSSNINVLKKGVLGNCESLVEVSLPARLEVIEDKAFLGCSKLCSVYFSENIVSIGNSSFKNCHSSIMLKLPNCITCLGEEAFAGCESLSEIIFSRNLKIIGQKCFIGCKSLSRISIPNSVKELGCEAFAKCDLLSKVSLSEGLDVIGKKCFAYCRSLSSIVIPTSVRLLGDQVFLHCDNLVMVILSCRIDKIGKALFGGCKSLVKVMIPEGVTVIEPNAFTNCISLFEVSIPDSMNYIERNAFYNCSSLSDIFIPDGVISIGINAFAKCSSLSNIVIPDSVYSIGNGAFNGCSLSYDFKQELISRFGDKKFKRL